MLLAAIDGTVRPQNSSLRASWIWRGAYASVACRKLEGNAILGRKDIDSNSFIRLNELCRVADEAVLRDLDALVVPVQQVERLGHELQLCPVAGVDAASEAKVSGGVVPTVPRIAPVEVSWAKAAGPNHKAEIKKQGLTLDIDSHPRLNRIADESRIGEGDLLGIALAIIGCL